MTLLPVSTMSANWHIWYTFYDHSSKHRPGTWIPLFWIEKCNMSVSNCWHICAEFLLDVCIVWGFPLEAFVPSVPWRQNRANVSSECLSSAPTPHPWMYLSKLQNVFCSIAKCICTDLICNTKCIFLMKRRHNSANVSPECLSSAPTPYH